MNYWWLVKRYGDEPIRVKEKTAQAVSEALSNGSEFISINGTTVATKAISGVEKSSERIEENNPYLLEAPLKLKPYGKGTPLVGPTFKENGIEYEGAVLCNWYKKNIERREWETYYSKLPYYYRIDDADQAIWVAFRLPEEEGTTKPNYLFLCNEDEVNRLEQLVGA